jgi:hypothetical protein
VYAGNRIAGSNPAPSANRRHKSRRFSYASQYLRRLQGGTLGALIPA